jgi:hypothetical protein
VEGHEIVNGVDVFVDRKLTMGDFFDKNGNIIEGKDLFGESGTLDLLWRISQALEQNPKMKWRIEMPALKKSLGEGLEAQLKAKGRQAQELFETIRGQPARAATSAPAAPGACPPLSPVLCTKAKHPGIFHCPNPDSDAHEPRQTPKRIGVTMRQHRPPRGLADFCRGVVVAIDPASEAKHHRHGKAPILPTLPVLSISISYHRCHYRTGRCLPK